MINSSKKVDEVHAKLYSHMLHIHLWHYAFLIMPQSFKHIHVHPTHSKQKRMHAFTQTNDVGESMYAAERQKN